MERAKLLFFNTSKQQKTPHRVLGVNFAGENDMNRNIHLSQAKHKGQAFGERY